jgi:hypothetical protein
MKKLFLLIFFMVLLGASLQAQYKSQAHGHEGFYLSMALGGSYFSLNDDITNGPYKTMDMKGSAMLFDLKLGYAMSPNFILHGDLFGISSLSVEVTADGQTLGTVSGDNSVGVTMFGAGGTYYFLPGNFFISGTVGVSAFSITQGTTSTSTQSGLGLNFKMGKEWWVSKRWGLGASLLFNYTNVNNEVDNMTEKLKGTSFGICFNASRN